jgi:hypothetical protein
MDKNELIAQQQIEIEEWKQENAELVEMKDALHRELYCIGGPFSDNVLMFDKEQLKVFIRIQSIIG